MSKTKMSMEELTGGGSKEFKQSGFGSIPTSENDETHAATQTIHLTTEEGSSVFDTDRDGKRQTMDMSSLSQSAAHP